jgi:hypothetical protein
LDDVGRQEEANDGRKHGQEDAEYECGYGEQEQAEYEENDDECEDREDGKEE